MATNIFTIKTRSGKTPEERFWAKVDKSGECWLWTANTSSGGYARFCLNGKLVQGHRVSYEILVGPIPDGLDLDHLCRVRNCVNPAHLEPVTRQENCRRGDSGKMSAARQLAKTHCPQGHPYSGGNLLSQPNGSRRCRECRRLASKTWKRK